MKDLQKTLEREWQDVRKSFYYPQLPFPQLTKDIANGMINFENLQISVNPEYVNELNEKGCNEEISLNAILGHEVGHFVDYPASVLNLLRLHKIARENLDEQKAYIAREAFLNIQNNTNLVKNRDYKSIPVVLKSEAEKAEGLDKVFFGLYQELWNKSLDVKLKRKEKNLIEKLQEIDYLDKNKQEQNLREFVELIKNKLDDYKSEGNSSFKEFSSNQIREGIRQFAKESKPGEFEKIVEEVLREGEKNKGTEKGREKIYQITGSRAGIERGNLIIARNFYSALAENFSIPIRKRQIQKNGSLYPYSHEEFSMSDEINDLDPFSSPGIIPGITQKWIKKEGETIQNYFGIPNSIIVKDNSPSMTNYQNPEKEVSIAVLGSTVISNAYLNNNTKVAVYSFGSFDEFVDLTKDKERVHQELRKYTNKRGTTFNKSLMENYLKNTDMVFDLSFVSDMEISNLDKFINHIINLPNLHRIHLFYTNPSKVDYVQNISERIKNKRNVAILPLYSQQDIKNIIIGELKNSIK